jgi:hypothetical protein
VDKFRRDHRQELGIHDDKGATGTVGEQSLALMRKLNKTQNYPIRQDA